MGAMNTQQLQEVNGADDIVQRSAKRLAACLACDICCGLLVEPLTSPQCMHCFCRECIAGFIVHGQSTSCPVCTAEGVDTPLGPDPLRDQLRVDFMITDLLRKISGQLAPLAPSREARVLQWQALNREVLERTPTTARAAEPAAKPSRVLPADGAGCVELFVLAPVRMVGSYDQREHTKTRLPQQDQTNIHSCPAAEDHEIEQPYIRCHESVTVAALARFLQERILLAAGDQTVQLRCRQQLLQSEMTLGQVQEQIWRPHASNGQILQITWDQRVAEDVPS